MRPHYIKFGRFDVINAKMTVRWSILVDIKAGLKLQRPTLRRPTKCWFFSTLTLVYSWYNQLTLSNLLIIWMCLKKIFTNDISIISTGKQGMNEWCFMARRLIYRSCCARIQSNGWYWLERWTFTYQTH